MKRRALIPGTLVVLSFVVAPAVRAQEIVDEALQVFSTRTERLEYLNSDELRGLSNYSVLRQRYRGGGTFGTLRSPSPRLGSTRRMWTNWCLDGTRLLPAKTPGRGGSTVLLAVIFAGKRLPNGLWSIGWNRPRLVIRKPIA